VSFVERILAASGHDDAISELVMTELMGRGLSLDDAVTVTDWYVRRVMAAWLRSRGAPS
jgi:hypothetical protein